MKRLRNRNDRGATLVEAAIVMLPLFVIIFGIIEFGWLFKDDLSISNAARSGSRTAAAAPLDTSLMSETVDAVTRRGNGATYNPGDQLCVYQVRRDGGINSNGKLSVTNCNITNHARLYTWTAGAWVSTQPPVSIWSDGTPNVCAGSPNYDAIGVYIRMVHQSVTGFFPAVTLNEYTVTRFEPQLAPSQGCT